MIVLGVSDKSDRQPRTTLPEDESDWLSGFKVSLRGFFACRIGLRGLFDVLAYLVALTSFMLDPTEVLAQSRVRFSEEAVIVFFLSRILMCILARVL